jgi:hypothetical protein
MSGKFGETSVAVKCRLGRTVITTFGRDFATASTEFFFADIDRVGRQSQSWVRLDGDWRIASAHVSFMRA